MRKSADTARANEAEASQAISTRNSSRREDRFGRCWIWAIAPQPTTPRRTRDMGRLLTGLSRARSQLIPPVCEGVKRDKRLPEPLPHSGTNLIGAVRIPG